MYDLQIEIEIAEEVQICYMVQAVAQSNYYFKIKRSKIKVSLIKPQARTASWTDAVNVFRLDSGTGPVNYHIRETCLRKVNGQMSKSRDQIHGKYNYKYTDKRGAFTALQKVTKSATDTVWLLT